MKVNRSIRIIIFTVVILSAFGTAIWYFTSFKYLTVTYKNSHDISIYKASTLDSGKENPRPVAKINKSGEKVKLRPGEYTIYYKGDSGFDSRYVTIKVDSKDKKISITPGYTEDRLISILDEELPVIKQAIIQKYPSINGLYDIRTGKLYHNGDWYGTTLVYRGNNVASSDTLRIVLRKNGDVWEVMTNPPDISLSRFSYPDVPIDILRDINLQ